MGDGSLAVPAASLKGASMVKAPELKNVQQDSRPASGPTGAESAALSSSPAIQQLASENPEFGRQFIEALPWYQKVLEKTQREIAALREFKSLLEKLDRRIRPERILKHVAGFVLLEQGPWKSNLQENKVRLRRLAKRVRKMADKVEATYSSDSIRPELWAMQLGVLTETVPLYDFQKAIEGMRQTSDDLNKKAQGFGLVRHAITPAVRRQPLVSLLQHAYRATFTNWDWPESRHQFRRDCLQPLAELLDAVCEKRGIKKSTTRESLEKLLVRYVLPEVTGS
jgi:hypothetical protein